MKKNTNKILIILFSLILINCDDKINSLEELNKVPTLEYFSRNTTEWTKIEGKIIDSAKVYNEKNNANYSIALRSKDFNNNFETITINDAVNGGNFFLNDELFKNQKMVSLDSFALSYRFFNKDIRLFTIKTIDDFGKFEKVEFEIHFLENLAPIADFELRNENVNGIVEYIIDASFSKDRDYSRGGFISNYEFSINGILINSTNSKIKHIFEKGEHIIALRVKDNDGVFSEQIIKTLFIN